MLTLLPVMASSAEPVKIGDNFYNLNSSTLEAEVTNSAGGDPVEFGSYYGSVSIPNSVKASDGKSYTVTRIGDRAFVRCSGVTSIRIRSSVTSIGKYAFFDCSGLTSVTIPSDVTSIEDGTFINCKSLPSITIPDGVTSIGESAFQGCSGLTSVTMGNNVITIGKGAFGYCSGLKSITIPNSVTSIGSYAFCYCTGLTSVTIPSGVKSIGEYAFSECSDLTSVTSLMENPIVINENVFSDYTSATLYVPFGTKAIYKATRAWFMFQEIREIIPLIDGIYYNLYAETSEAEVTNRLGGDVKGKGSYSGSVVIPSTVNYGGVKYNVTSIGNRAFWGSSGLTSVTIPNGVKEMGYYAFESCTDLTSFTIPNSIKRLSEGVFQGCSGLTSITIPNSVTSIGHSAFSGCNGLTSVTIPNSVTSLENYAFSTCSSLTSVTIPNSVTSLGARVFWECSGLTSVSIPASVTSIGEGVFHNCSSLVSVTSWITNPFEINENVFWIKGVFNTSATLYVPKGTKAKYQATPAWNMFQKIEEKVQKGDVNEDGAVDVADIATIIDVMAKGIYDPVADVNGDMGIDVADIATIIDIMSGNYVEPEPQPEVIMVYKTCPDGNHPHWIDLGLTSGTVWACCNEGALMPEIYGNYYTFDEAQAYNPPSIDQIDELVNNTTSEWITQNGVSGRKFTGSNGGAVFLPAAGHIQSGEFYYGGTLGYYWSSKPNGSAYAYGLSFGSGGTSTFSWDSRNLGRSVRPVR